MVICSLFFEQEAIKKEEVIHMIWLVRLGTL